MDAQPQPQPQPQPQLDASTWDDAIEQLTSLVAHNTHWVLERVRGHAAPEGYLERAQRTEEEWLDAIAELSDTLFQAAFGSSTGRDFGEDGAARLDPVVAYGALHARAHHARDVTLEEYLGLLGTYRRSYHELMTEAGHELPVRTVCRSFIDGFFERIEEGFRAEWDLLEAGRIPRPAELDN